MLLHFSTSITTLVNSWPDKKVLQLWRRVITEVNVLKSYIYLFFHGSLSSAWSHNCWSHGSRRRWTLNKKYVDCRRNWQRVEQRDRSWNQGAALFVKGWGLWGVANVLLTFSPIWQLSFYSALSVCLSLACPASGRGAETIQKADEGRERERGKTSFAYSPTTEQGEYVVISICHLVFIWHHRNYCGWYVNYSDSGSYVWE